MPTALNALELDIPEITATIFAIDPQPEGDAYSQLYYYEKQIENELSAKANRWKHPDRDDWFIATIEPDEERIVEPDSGITLRPIATHALDQTRFWDQKLLAKSIKESVEWFFMREHDFWKDDDIGAIFYSDRRTRVGKYDAYTGFVVRARFHDRPQLVVSPVTKFVHNQTLADLLEHTSIDDVRSTYQGRGFLYESDEPSNCTLASISESKTVSHETIDWQGDVISVKEFARRNYGKQYADTIPDDEPLAHIRYGDSDPYDAAPSLLRATPQEMTNPLTAEAAMSANDRLDAVEDFVGRISYVQVEGSQVQISSDLIEPTTQGTFEYPELVFGESGNLLSIGTTNTADDEQRVVSKGSWRYAVRDYLREYGYWDVKQKVLDIALVYADEDREISRDAYHDIREYLSTYGGLQISNTPDEISYSDRHQFDRWVREYGDEIDGIFGVLDTHGDVYHDVVNRFEGKPAQFILTDNYRSTRGQDFSNVLFNTAIGLGTKVGNTPFGMGSELQADAYLGWSVAGDQSTTATAALISGDDGRLLHHTKEPYGRGPSNVSDEYTTGRLVENALTTQQSDDEIGSLVVTRNGQFGDEEIAGIERAIGELKDDGYLRPDCGWSAIGIYDANNYRTFDMDEHTREVDTGAYAKLDTDNVVLTTFGAPQIHQGTPDPLLCQRRFSTLSFDIVDVARDVFYLSFMNWGAPMNKMKPPITTKIASELNEAFERLTRVEYPPF